MKKPFPTAEEFLDIQDKFLLDIRDEYDLKKVASTEFIQLLVNSGEKESYYIFGYDFKLSPLPLSHKTPDLLVIFFRKYSDEHKNKMERLFKDLDTNFRASMKAMNFKISIHTFRTPNSKFDNGKKIYFKRLK
ncbi:MAG: hypothetical protein IPP32_12840 [Bacteroidetes bacterium]|nr:hypothetical protein [Bacteroidota bacterium]